MHHAVVYEMPTAAAPENAMAKRSRPRVSGGLCTREQKQSDGGKGTYKFRSKLLDPQSSITKENTSRTGIDSRLL